jgi:4a-hydroxytetrahydrobiopterin dehydratase
MIRLTEAQLRAALGELPSWRLVGGKLYREVAFPDFKAAFAFMTRIAAAADEMDHHPEWWNCYGRVRIWLMTHDAGGISDRDVALARRIGA